MPPAGALEQVANHREGCIGSKIGLVADELERETDQDRCERCEPRRYIVFQMAEVANPRSRDKTLFFLPPAIPVMANFECLIINQFPANDSPVARK
jgi:hypothetical protein